MYDVNLKHHKTITFPKILGAKSVNIHRYCQRCSVNAGVDKHNFFPDVSYTG